MPLKSHAVFTYVSTIGALSIIFCSNTALSQEYSPRNREGLLEAVTRCRDLQDDNARLACFDAAATNLAAAGELTVVSRQDVQQNQRRLFGFNVSIANPFDREGRSEELQSISGTMIGARNLGRGEWIITLDDGSTWRKVDGGDPIFSARRQYPVTVRRAALGSYMMKVGDTPPFRVRRE
ncbi:hypothetical protein [Brevundimonas sp. Marseille-Q4549]